MNLALRCLPALLLVLASPLAAAPATPPAPLRLEIDPAEIVANADFTWTVTLRITNSGALGAYMDSVTCRMEDTDAGESRKPRTRRITIGSIRSIESVGSGETTEFVYSAPAPFEAGRLAFDLFAHLGDGTPLRATANATVKPGPSSFEHPSEFVEAGGSKVEVVLFRSARTGASPAVLLVHDHGAHARSLLPVAAGLAARGCHVMLVSQPGYGRSEGPADLMGPRTVAAVRAALDRLEHTDGVDPARVAAWGIGRGAGVVANLATARPGLAAVIAQSATYDLWAAYRALPADARPGFVAEAGTDSAAWRQRSPLLAASKVAGAWLVIHGEADPESPVAGAREFVALAQVAGATVESHYIPAGGHVLGRVDSHRFVFAFLAARLGF